MRHFDLCVIGTGSGNSIVDESFADSSVALVDDGVWFGGTCLNVGCIPTKMFVHPADLADEPEHARTLGVDLEFRGVDWPQVRDRVFGRIDPIAAGGEDWRRRNENVTLFRTRVHFVGPKRLRTAEGEEFTADRIVIAAGSRVSVPDVPGLDPAWWNPADTTRPAWAHTSNTVMRLPELPQRMVIVGGGFIAAEFAHVFAAFGVQVTVLLRGDRMLRSEDEEVSRRFTELIARRVQLVTGADLEAVEASGDGGQAVTVVTSKGRFSAEVVLFATGRVSNADTLALEATGVAVDDAGHITVDAEQRTSVEGIWALGDVANDHQLKHVANYEAKVVKHNLRHPDSPIVNDGRPVPHAVFSHPQVASVGLTEQAAREQGIDVVTAVQEYGSVAYGWAMEDTDHFVKLVADRSTGQLVGGHLMGPDAANLVQPIIQAMTFGLGVREMAEGQYWIHPALTEVVENALLALEVE